MNNFIHNITDTKLKKVVLSIIILLILNFIINLTTGHNFIAKAYEFLSNLGRTSQEEIKYLEINSNDYNNYLTGGYKILKKGDWINNDTAKIEFYLDSHMSHTIENKDVIILLDTSNNLCDTNIKEHLKEGINQIITRNDSVALITFNNEAELINNFTNSGSSIKSSIDNLTCASNNKTNYYSALTAAYNLLDNTITNKNIEILLITNNYPNVSTPNEVGEYEILKNKFSNITIEAIQYNLGNNIISSIEKITDNAYAANEDNFLNTLYEAIIKPQNYQFFEVIEYLDNNYYDFTGNFTSTIGEITIEEDNNQPILKWRIDRKLLTGHQEYMSYEIRIKNNLKNNQNYYPVNTNTNIKYKIGNLDIKEENTQDTIILKSGYTLTIDPNFPEGCHNTITTERYLPFTQLNKPTSTPICTGYQFKGWDIAEKDFQMLNSDTFLMPTHDTTIRGKWSKLTISKSMEGTVFEKTTLYRTIGKMAVLDNQKSPYVKETTGINFKNQSSDTNGKGVYEIASTSSNTYPIYYFRGDVNYNNLIFADICWKIFRTTDTGGIKIIYDGIPINNTCQGLRTTDAIKSGTYSTSSIAQVGYSYVQNLVASWEKGDYKWYDLVTAYTGSKSGLSGTNYIYGKATKYENGTYTITDGELHNWTNDYRNLKEYVTCYSTTNTCTELYYITYAYSTSANHKIIPAGKTYEDVYNEGYSKYEMYGSDVTYANGKYTLVNPVLIHKMDMSSSTSIIATHRYSCRTEETSCTTVQYFYNTSSSGMNYVTLKSGDNITTALNKSLSLTGTNSSFKTNIENWYQEHILPYESYLEDTPFCNDRTLVDYGAWNPTNSSNSQLYFSTAYRFRMGTPSFTCRTEDTFTKSNGKLAYPVGMLTIDEAMYAGMAYNRSVPIYLSSPRKPDDPGNSYLLNYFLLSPSELISSAINTYYMYPNGNNGYIGSGGTSPEKGLRPVVSLKSGIEYLSGDGTPNYPYIIN